MKTKKDNNPKIVFMGRYNASEKLSGPEKVSKRIFTEHSKSNKTYFIQYFFDGRHFSLSQKIFGKTEERITENSVLYTTGLFKVYGLLKQLKPDIIHIIMFERFAVIVLLYKFFNKVKIVYNEHGVTAYENSELKKTSLFYRFKDKFCEKRLLKCSDKIVFVSAQAIDIAERYYDIDEAKSVIMANGVDTVFNSNITKDFSRKLKAVFIYQNELYKSGLEFLNKYMNKFNPEIDLYIIFNSDLDLNFKANIVKPMSTEDLSEFYRNKHIFFTLNKYDTFSIAAGEAMASGLVPIMTKETGISRYIEDCYNGYRLNYGDVNALNNAVSSFIELPDNAKEEMSQKASSIYNELKWENIYDSYRNIYSGTIK
jgi:glycosyltransferase involved in cell wall biosynthesis